MTTCAACGKPFSMGVDGTVRYLDFELNLYRKECDSCAGIERDKEGHAWEKGEQVHHYRPAGGPDDGSRDFIVTREEAFDDKT